MSDLIDRDKLYRLISENYPNCGVIKGQFLKDIDCANAVDAVEIVRCRECDHWDRHTEVDVKRGQCHKWEATMNEAGYCHCGKRRESEVTQ